MSIVANRLWALDGATATVDAGTLVLDAEGDVTFPIPTFLIEHPHGLVLFDTGISTDAADDPRAVFGELANAVSLNYSREQRVDYQIRALGYRIERIDPTQSIVTSYPGGPPKISKAEE